MPPEPAADLVTLRIAGVPEHFNLPWHLGLERRAFVRAKIDLKWRTVPEGSGAMCDLLRKGEVDLALLVTEAAVRDILNGNPARILAQYVDTPLTWGIHVGADSAVMGPAQLATVPYAISRKNSGSHLVALAYARAQGRSLHEEDLLVVNDLAGATVRLRTGTPTAFLWEKFTTKKLVDTGVFRRVDEFRNAWPAFVIVASERVLSDHPEALQRLLKVIADQAQGLMQKKTAPEIIAQRYGLSVDDAREWFQAVRWNTDRSVDPASLYAVAEALHDAGAIQEIPTPDELRARLLPATVQG